MNRHVSQAEWRWVATVALIVLFLSSLPYVAGCLAQTPEQVFVGAVYDWEDYYSHLAKMQQGARGSWRYRILFTPEEHAGAYINTFYIALGHVAGFFGLSSVLVYHIARVLFAAVFLLVIYWFVALFISDQDVRRTAYLLACFSSGLGWLVLLVTRSYTLGGITPVDLWFIEMYTFFTVMIFPHACLAQALYLVSLACIVRLLRGEGGWRMWSLAAAAVLVTTVIHPYSLLPLHATLALYCLYLWLRHRGELAGRLPWLIGFVLVPIPLAIYQYVGISSCPVFDAWQDQSNTLSPPPVHYLLGYGLVLALAVWGGIRVLRGGRDVEMVLVLWPLVVGPLLYASLFFHLQRRMIDGVHVPLAALAAIGMDRALLPTLRQSRLAGWLARIGYPRPHFCRLMGRLTLALTTLSNWYLLASLVLAVLGRYDPLYHSRAEVDAVRWLGKNTLPQEIVLSSYEIGGYIPAHIGHRVFWGHWAETIHLAEKRTEAQLFYATGSGLDRPAFLDRYDIVYVFHGPREREMGAFDLAAAPYLEAVFRFGDVNVYRVREEQ